MMNKEKKKKQNLETEMYKQIKESLNTINFDGNSERRNIDLMDIQMPYVDRQRNDKRQSSFESNPSGKMNKMQQRIYNYRISRAMNSEN